VDEPSVGRGLRLTLTEDPDLVAHARAPEVRDAEAGVDGLGEGNGLQVCAMRLDAQADHVAAGDVEAALVDEVRVDDGIEIRVVDDVVDVTVDVVVHPARGDGQEVTERVARGGFRFAGHAATGTCSPVRD